MHRGLLFEYILKDGEIMDVYAPLVRCVVAPLWAKWERSPYLGQLRLLREQQYDEAEVVQARQWERLKALLRHAYETVPYYQTMFESLGAVPEDLASIHDFRRLPVLTKADIRTSGKQLLSSAFDSERCVVKTTSGSTGVSLRVYMDNRASQWKRAYTVFRNEWAGYRVGDRVAAIWGNPEPKQGGRAWLRNTLLDRWEYLDTIRMGEDDIAAFVKKLRKRPVTMIFGHAHSVYLFAEYVQKHGITDLTFSGAITSAMVLHEHERRSIQDGLSCNVFDRYGCEEVSLIASECEAHMGLHVNTELLHVDIVAGERLATAGQEGAIIVTDLTNYAMPIIRYKVGDMAIPSAKYCVCGRQSSVLERVTGREADYVTTPDGRLISGISMTENFAMKIPGLVQLQIIQETLEHLTLRVVRGQGFSSESERVARRLVDELLGEEVILSYEFVEMIPQEPSGKYRFCISKVRNALTELSPCQR